ncbi:MAG: glutaredoxin family protein [Dehalococcoidia bacterium]|nr:glutaredoxin family protein [Dehalococcoidia bacterium]
MSRDVTLYTRTHCGLCEEAEDELRRLEPEFGFTLTTCDVDADPTLRLEYNARVPVICVDGREVAAAPIDPGRLATVLRTTLR